MGLRVRYCDVTQDTIESPPGPAVIQISSWDWQNLAKSNNYIIIIINQLPCYNHTLPSTERAKSQMGMTRLRLEFVQVLVSPARRVPADLLCAK